LKANNKLGNNKLFDPKMGLAGALFLGTIVFLINYDHGFINGLIAALKQGFYTFFVGGFITRLCENIATISKKLTAVLMAVFIPSIIAISLTYLVHSIKGTPEPFNSTIPTIILAPLGFLWWALQKRKQLKRTDNSN
jgi:ABC-type dipeptide/oligopeptide/nickel transport system permease subunit